MTLKTVHSWPFTFGGVHHSGWLPPEAAIPKPTPIEHALLDVRIEQIDGGYLLIWSAQVPRSGMEQGPPRGGDTWYETIADAESAAEEAFGIKPEHWTDCAESS